MQTNIPRPSLASAWTWSLVATLLGGACVAPEFRKVDALEGTGGAGGATVGLIQTFTLRGLLEESETSSNDLDLALGLELQSEVREGQDL